MMVLKDTYVCLFNQVGCMCGTQTVCVLACRSLHGVDIDKAEREIYMPIGSGGTDPATGLPAPPEALLVDFDNSNVGDQQHLRAGSVLRTSAQVGTVLGVGAPRVPRFAFG